MPTATRCSVAPARARAHRASACRCRITATARRTSTWPRPRSSRPAWPRHNPDRPPTAARHSGRAAGAYRPPTLLGRATMHVRGAGLVACEHDEGVDVDVARARYREHDAIRNILGRERSHAFVDRVGGALVTPETHEAELGLD